MAPSVLDAIEKRIEQVSGDKAYLCRKMQSLHDGLDALLDSGSPRWSSVATLATEISITAMHIDNCNTELRFLLSLGQEATRSADSKRWSTSC